MVIRQPHALSVERVQVGRLENRVTVTGEIAIPLVVGDDKHDIGFLRLGGKGNDQ